MRRADVDLLGGGEFFEMSLDHLCVAGFDGYWKWLNPAWTQTLGFSLEELMSRPLIEFCHPEDREMTLAARARLTTGEPLRALLNRYVCKDGSFRWFEWRSVANPERRLVYAIARDVTAEREAQQALREAREAQERMQHQLMLADRMASVGTLAAGVAHEINNPLSYVLANLDMILEDLEGESLPGRRAEYAAMAREAKEGAERIRAIVRGLKTFSRAHEERRVVTDVTRVLDVSIQIASNEIRHRAQLVKEYGPIPLVDADDSRLGQVFLNLLVNAAQAIGDGGTEHNEIRVVTGTDAAGNAFVEVRDTGTGIPEAIRSKIFDPFFTTKPIGVGTGLGLSICHNIVTSMHGTIAVHDRAPHGSVFRVTLPATSQAAAFDPSAPPPRAAASPAQRRMRVLVIDDEPQIGQMLRRRLPEHELVALTSARDALALVDRSDFDVVLSDLMMPDMSGMQLYAELTRLRPELARRFVFMTGGAFTEAAHEFLDRIPNECLEKPFTASAVRAAFARVTNAESRR